jgi:hypothetical protein
VMPQLIMYSTFSVGVTTAGAGVVKLVGMVPPPDVLHGLPCVIVSLPILMLSWYLWAVNDVMQTILTSRKDPSQKLADVSCALGPILSLLKLVGKVPKEGE